MAHGRLQLEALIQQINNQLASAEGHHQRQMRGLRAEIDAQAASHAIVAHHNQQVISSLERRLTAAIGRINVLNQAFDREREINGQLRVDVGHCHQQIRHLANQIDEVRRDADGGGCLIQ